MTPETAQTKSSPNTTAYYRFTHLENAAVYIHADAPKDIQEALDAIVKAELSKERQDQLKAISQAFHESCLNAVRAAISEDDFVHDFSDVLKAMRSENLLSP